MENITERNIFKFIKNDWKYVLPEDSEAKSEILKKVVDGIRERWSDERKYIDLCMIFPVQVGLFRTGLIFNNSL